LADRCIPVQVSERSLAATWPRIKPLIEKAAARSHGRYSEALIRAYAQSGKWQIWIALDEGGICAVGGSEIVIYDTGLKGFVIHFGTGRERGKWQHAVEDMVGWGKANGCVLAEGVMRKGWRRVLPNWNHSHDFLERVL
jgi:hypothetical protein